MLTCVNIDFRALVGPRVRGAVRAGAHRERRVRPLDGGSRQGSGWIGGSCRGMGAARVSAGVAAYVEGPGEPAGEVGLVCRCRRRSAVARRPGALSARMGLSCAQEWTVGACVHLEEV